MSTVQQKVQNAISVLQHIERAVSDQWVIREHEERRATVANLVRLYCIEVQEEQLNEIDRSLNTMGQGG